jgi:hypothetical protein
VKQLRLIRAALPWVLLAGNGSALGVYIALAVARGWCRVDDLVAFVELGTMVGVCIIWIEHRTRPTKESVE